MNPAKITAILVTRGDVDLTQPLYSIGAARAVTEILVWRNGEALVRYEVKRWDDNSYALVLDEKNELGVPDLAVYGRYAAIEHASNSLIYVQDDDCTVDLHRFFGIATSYRAQLEAGETILSNMPVSRWDDYPDSCLVGWGALFHRDLPALAFAQLGFDGRTSPFIGDDWTDYRYRNTDGITVELPDTGPMLRECDVVFTTLTPHVKADVGFTHLPWAEDPARAMFLSPRPDRPLMLDLARRIRDHRP